MKIPYGFSLIRLLMLGHLAIFVTSQSSYDFLYLVQTWPGSYHWVPQNNDHEKVEAAPANFGIHGLWPMYNDGTYPSNCNLSNPLQIQKIATLTTKLAKEWPSLIPTQTNEEFWSIEWLKHGTCSETVLDQHNYFNAALQLKPRTDILQTLKVAGINPDGQFYSLRNIEKVLKAKVGHTPRITCNTNGSNPDPELYEIYFCVDRKGANFIDCPFTKVDPRCGKDENPKVKFPAYSPHAFFTVFPYAANYMI